MASVKTKEQTSSEPIYTVRAKRNSTRIQWCLSKWWSPCRLLQQTH